MDGTAAYKIEGFRMSLLSLSLFTITLVNHNALYINIL